MKNKHFKKIREVKMSELEKHELFKRISQSIQTNQPKTALRYPIRSPFSFTFIATHRYVQVGAFAAFLLLFTGTTTFASLTSLPGDLLYEVKTNVVEKIPYVVYRSPEKRAEYVTKRIDARIYEFEKLAEQGALTQEKTNKIEENLNENFAQFDEDVQKIKEMKRAKVTEAPQPEILPPENAPRLMKMAAEPETAGITATAQAFPEEEKEYIEKKLERKLERHAEKIKQIRERERGEVRRALESVIERAEEAHNEGELEYEEPAHDLSLPIEP